jgi:hypothetical protein
MGIFRGPGGTGDATGDATNQASIAIAAANTATSAASAASTQATNASNSASAALISETNAENLYDEFDDRYLGAKASDPTLDNDGNALITGALYFNTVSDRTKVYDGTSWDFVALDAGILAAPDGSSLIGFQQDGAGAVARTAQNKLRETISVKDFGAVGDDVTDDTAAIIAAIAYLDGIGGGSLYFPAGTYLVSSELRISNGVRLIGDGVYLLHPNPAGAGSGAIPTYGTVIKAKTGSSPFKLIHVRAQTDYQCIYGFSIHGILLHGNAIATHGLHHVNTRSAQFNFKVFNTTVYGVLEEAISQVTNDNRYEDVEVTVNLNIAACANCIGVAFLSGDATGFTVGAIVQRLRVFVNNAIGIEIGAMDGGHFDMIEIKRNVAGPELVLLGVETASNGVTQPKGCRKNYFADYTGSVLAKTGSYANQIGYMQSEFGGATIQSGATLRYTVHDRTHGDWFKNQDYLLEDSYWLPARLFSADAANQATSSVLTAKQLYMLSFPDASTRTSGVVFAMPSEWNDGNITGIELLHSKDGTNTGDVLLDIGLSAMSTTNTISATQRATPVVNVLASSRVLNSTIIPISLNLVKTHKIISVSIGRTGADASDTFVDPWLLFGVRLIYVSPGPNSPGAGVYNAGDRFLS